MLANQPERRMRRVRLGILIAWFVLIVSLFWDPLTPLLTRATNIGSPFHIHDNVRVSVQGVELPRAPYPMGARIFWTMILPLVPLVLMLFGHETWRRVCPLSHFSQIPRMLGWQRQVGRLNRRNGVVERVLALVPNESWMRRNYLIFQFTFLACGIMGRLLFYNSDRLALVGIFAFMLSFALVIGLLYGGKTWCNYFCPISVIQDIYTGPGGLFDSRAVKSPFPITQSTCREFTPAGDRSTCVGCRSNCPDIDIENSYWKDIDSEPRRFVYFGYFGLVLAFYTYYYFYSGGWAYYFTGAWTHEEGQLSKLFAPGFYLGGQAIPIPKLLAVPLYFSLCIFAAYGLFLGVEWCLSYINAKINRPLTKSQIRHRMLTTVAFLTFNLFYIFAGRPNLLLMPPWAIRLIDAGLILVSATWLWRALGQDAEHYRKESLAKSLREQLRRMGFRSEELLEGRPLSRLSADEVYVLARTLPGFTLAQKREAYRAILVEVLETGTAKSADSLKLLTDLRMQLALSDSDHAAITEELGINDPGLLDPNQVRSAETQMRVNNYRTYLLGLMESEVSAGVSPRVLLTSDKVLAASEPFRTLYGISLDEHEKIVAEIASGGSKFHESASRLISATYGMEAQRFSLSFDPRPECRLISQALMLRQRRLVGQAVNLMAGIKDPALARPLAQAIYALMGEEANSFASDAPAGMPEGTVQAVREWTADRPPFSYIDVVAKLQPADEVLREMSGDSDPLVAILAASALTMCKDELPVGGRDLASGIIPETVSARLSEGLAAGSQLVWLMTEIVAEMAEGRCSERVATMATLLSIDAFSRLELGALAEIARDSPRVNFNPGETICRSGDVSDQMFVLVSGETQTWIERDGRRMILGTGHPGAVFGELGVITGKPRSASVEAAGDAPVTVVAIPREAIERLLSHDLTAARGILDVVSGYLADTLAVTRQQTQTRVEVLG